jgi:chromosome segregation ATPase
VKDEVNAEKLEKDLIVYRRKQDEMKNKTASKREHMRSLQDKQNEIIREQVDINSDDHPQMRTIRVMENRLDKAMIKFNEAMSIKKTYELIAKRLKEERIGYENQLTAIETSLRGKEEDLQELMKLSQDAEYTKEQAELDLKKYEEATITKFDDTVPKVVVEQTTT